MARPGRDPGSRGLNLAPAHLAPACLLLVTPLQGSADCNEPSKFISPLILLGRKAALRSPSYFGERDKEAQRGEVTCLRSHDWPWQSQATVLPFSTLSGRSQVQCSSSSSALRALNIKEPRGYIWPFFMLHLSQQTHVYPSFRDYLLLFQLPAPL